MSDELFFKYSQSLLNWEIIYEGARVIYRSRYLQTRTIGEYEGIKVPDVYLQCGTVRALNIRNGTFYIRWDYEYYNRTMRGTNGWGNPQYFSLVSEEDARQCLINIKESTKLFLEKMQRLDHALKYL